MDGLLPEVIELYEQHCQPRRYDRDGIEEVLAFGNFIFTRLVKWHHHRSTCGPDGARRLLDLVFQWREATEKLLKISAGGGAAGDGELRINHNKGTLMQQSLYDQLRMTEFFDETRGPLLEGANAYAKERLENPGRPVGGSE